MRMLLSLPWLRLPIGHRTTTDMIGPDRATQPTRARADDARRLRVGAAFTGSVVGGRCRRLLAASLLGAALAGCGGGGSGSAPETAAAASIEAGPPAVLLTQAGQEASLVAVVHDAQGQAIADAPLAWRSSAPGSVAVDAAGRVRALAGSGSAWVTASSGGVTSAPVLVTIARPQAGVRLLEDRQFVSGPQALDPNALPAAGASYEVLLRDITGLAPGALLVSAGAAPVAGRVESVTTDAGGQLRVRLAAVPLSELFADWSFDHRIELAQAALEVPADLAALYDVTREGARFDFTPRAGAWRDQPSAATRPRERPAAVQGTRALGPFGCEGETTQAVLPMALSVPPLFSVTVGGDANFTSTPAGMRLRLTSQPVLNLTVEVDVTSAFEAKLECRVVVLHAPVKVPGWAALFFGGQVTLGAGFEVGGKVTLVSAKLGGTAELKPTINADLECAAGHCGLGGGVIAGPLVAKPVLQAPSIDQTQFAPSASLFAFIDLSAGGPVGALQFEAVKTKAGVELGASLTLESLQIGNRHAEEGRSKYELKFAGDVGPGIALGGLLGHLGLTSVVPLKLTFEEPLGGSPTGTVGADKGQVAPNAPVTVTVTLDAASTRFPAGSDFYNVERIVLLRRVDASTTEELAAVDAADGQTTFTLTFTNALARNLEAREIHAFVVTKALPLDPPRLEIGAALVPIVSRSGLVYASAAVTFPDDRFAFFLQEQDETNRLEDPPFIRQFTRTATIPTTYDRSGAYGGLAETLRDDVIVDPATGEVRGGAFHVRSRCSASPAVPVEGSGLTAVKHASMHTGGRLLRVITNGRSAATLRVTGVLNIVASAGATDARAYFWREAIFSGASLGSAGNVNTKAIDETFPVAPFERLFIGVELLHNCYSFLPVQQSPAEASLSFTLTPQP
jgi:hypothetical protein